MARSSSQESVHFPSARLLDPDFSMSSTGFSAYALVDRV